MKKKSWIFIACYFAYTAIYIARVNLSMAAPELRELQVLTESQYGVLGSAFLVIYALGRLLTGSISDRKPPVLLICTGLVLCSVSNLCIGFLPPYVGMLLLWCVNALAQSMLWSSILCVMAAIYDSPTAKKKTSVLVTTVATGNILGILLPVYLIERLGLRWAFIAPGILTFAAATVIFFSIRTIPAPTATTSRPQKNILQLLSDPGLRTALVPTFFHGVMKDNVTLWMTVFFIDRYGVNLSQSAYSVLLIPVVGLIGRLLYPMVYQAFGNREHHVSRVSFLICLLASVLLCVNRLPLVAAMLCLSAVYAAVSMANTSFLSIYPMGFAQSGNVATVGGIMDFCTYLGAGAASLTYGFIIQNWGYLPMFVSWVVLSVLSLFFLKKLEAACSVTK